MTMMGVSIFVTCILCHKTKHTKRTKHKIVYAFVFVFS